MHHVCVCVYVVHSVCVTHVSCVHRVCASCVMCACVVFREYHMSCMRVICALYVHVCVVRELCMRRVRLALCVYVRVRHFDQEQIPFVSRKGIFPWFDGEQKMTETQLPPQSDFYSNLTEERVSNSDYLHAQNVWNQFQMSSFKQYHDLYLQTDVLLLSDVFEQFRSFAKNTCDLDPLHYYTLPGFFWEAMLKMTTTCGNTDHLDLITEPEQFLFIEKGIRGGISMISNRHAVANNPDVPNYDPSKPTNWLTYLDANNLYG